MEDSLKSTNNSLKIDDKSIPLIGESESDLDDDIQEKSIDEEPFPDTIKILESDNGSKVYLIGTAHFSEKSCEDVEYVMRRVKPDVVIVEICQDRFRTLNLDEKVLREHISNFKFSQAREIIEKNGLLQGIIQIFFLHFSKEIYLQTGVLPGSEIRTAIFESRKIPHCKLLVGDRAIQITFRRAIGSLSFYKKLRLIFSMLFDNTKINKDEVENFKQHDLLESVLEELGDNYPEMKKVLVDERDMYLAYSLQKACRMTPHDKNEFYTERLKNSRNSLASVEQQLTKCKHELENFKRIKSRSITLASDKPIDEQLRDEQIENYQTKLQSLEDDYHRMCNRVILDTENLTSFNRPINSPVNNCRSSNVVVGVVGIGHLKGIQNYFNKVQASDIEEIILVPEPSFESKVIKQVVKYSFYSFVIYGFYRYALPINLKSSIASLTTKSVSYSKEFLNEKLLALRH